MLFGWSILSSAMCYQCVLLFDSTFKMKQIHLVWVFVCWSFIFSANVCGCHESLCHYYDNSTGECVQFAVRAVGGDGAWGGRGRERRVRRNSSMLESSTASHYTCPTPLMMAPSSATSKAPSATGVYCSGIPHLTSPQCVRCASVCCVGRPTDSTGWW